MSEELTLLIEEAIHGNSTELTSFEDLETAARQYALKLAAQILESALNADHSDYVGPVHPCVCGNKARYAGRKVKTVVSVVGEMTLTRAYYWCNHCTTGWFPRDRKLKLERDSLSTGLSRMVGTTAALLSFKEADELVCTLVGVNVGAKQVERSAEKLGNAIAEDEKTEISAGIPCSRTMYLGMDSTGIPMRSQELIGRPGK